MVWCADLGQGGQGGVWFDSISFGVHGQTDHAEQQSVDGRTSKPLIEKPHIQCSQHLRFLTGWSDRADAASRQIETAL